MNGHTSLSREKLWVCPCLLDSLQLVGRFSFLQFRNGCGKQKASLLHQWQHAHSPANTRSNLQDQHFTFFLIAIWFKVKMPPSHEVSKKELYLKQGYILKIQFLSLPTYRQTLIKTELKNSHACLLKD